MRSRELTSKIVEAAEKVVAAAYRNVKTGQVITGRSHPLIIDRLLQQNAFGPRVSSWSDFEKRWPSEEHFAKAWTAGFTTNSGRFLTREEASDFASHSSRDDGPSAEDFDL